MTHAGRTHAGLPTCRRSPSLHPYSSDPGGSTGSWHGDRSGLHLSPGKWSPNQPCTVGLAPGGPEHLPPVCAAAPAPAPAVHTAPRKPAAAGCSGPAPPAALQPGPAAAAPAGETVWAGEDPRGFTCPSPPTSPGLAALRHKRTLKETGLQGRLRDGLIWSPVTYLQLPKASTLQLLLPALQLQLQTAPSLLQGEVLRRTGGGAPKPPPPPQKRQWRGGTGSRVGHGRVKAGGAAGRSRTGHPALGQPGPAVGEPSGRDQFEEGGARESSEDERTAHLALPAALLPLLPELLLQLLIEAAHFPLVVAFPPLETRMRQPWERASPTSAPHWGPTLTAAAPAPGRRAPWLPLLGRPTLASELPRKNPAAPVARAAARPRGPSQLAAWTGQV